jgi:chromosome segregation ATPase
MENDAIERLRRRIEPSLPHILSRLPSDEAAYLRAHIVALTAERDAAVAAINRQAKAIRALHANEETEINRLRKQRHEWHAATTSLDSERDANARLTQEVEQLTAERDALRQQAEAADIERNKAHGYWYRQGKDDGMQYERELVVAWLREQDGHGYDDMRADFVEAGEHLKGKGQ